MHILVIAYLSIFEHTSLIVHISYFSAYYAYFVSFRLCIKRNKSKQSKSAARTTSSRQRKISLEREEHDVVDAQEFLAVERTDEKGRVLTSSGRPSVKRNAVNGKYGTNYRNFTVTKSIRGKTATPRALVSSVTRTPACCNSGRG